MILGANPSLNRTWGTSPHKQRFLEYILLLKFSGVLYSSPKDYLSVSKHLKTTHTDFIAVVGHVSIVVNGRNILRYCNSSNASSTKILMYYKINLYFPFLDHLIQQLSVTIKIFSRFSYCWSYINVLFRKKVKSRTWYAYRNKGTIPTKFQFLLRNA